MEVTPLLPRVILHHVMSLDGRVTKFSLGNRLPSQPPWPWRADAYLTDNPEAVDADVPLPSVRDKPRPLLVVPDDPRRPRPWRALGRSSSWRGIVALCSRATPLSHLEYLAERHVGAIFAGQNCLNMHEALEHLNTQYGVRTVWVDGSSQLSGVLLRAGLVGEVRLQVFPCLLGEAGAEIPAPASPEKAIPLRLSQLEHLDNDLVWLRYEVVR